MYHADDASLQSASYLREKLKHETSTVFRHPATGISVSAGSVASGAGVLKTLGLDACAGPIEASGLPGLGHVFASDEGQTFLSALAVVNTSGKRKAVDDEGLKGALPTIAEFAQKNKKALLQQLGVAAVASSRLYLMAMAGLELTAALTIRASGRRSCRQGRRSTSRSSAGRHGATTSPPC